MLCVRITSLVILISSGSLNESPNLVQGFKLPSSQPRVPWVEFRRSGSPVTVRSPMEEEMEEEYNPSRWVVTSSPEEALPQHIAEVTAASEEARNKVPHVLNLKYGKGDGQYYDLYGTNLPDDSPIFIYIHGGYWQLLSKDISAYPVVPLWQAGIKSVIVGYDLAPKVNLDTIVEEIQQLAIHLFEMAKERGTSGLWFGGHSAGAHLSASLLRADWFNSVKPQLRCQMKGVVLISGIYDITPLIYTSNNDALKLDRKSALRQSPMFHLGSTEFKGKVLMVVAENDSPSFHGQTTSFGQLLKRKEINFQTVEIPQKDHFTVVASLQDGTYNLSQDIISFIKS